MKINILLISACLLFMASACTVNKRAHRPGYNVEWHSANPKPQKHPKAQEMEKQKLETEILAFGTEENPIIDELEEKLIEDEEMKEDNNLAGSSAEGILKHPFPFSIGQSFKPKNSERQRPDVTTELSQPKANSSDNLAKIGFILTTAGVGLSLLISIIFSILILPDEGLLLLLYTLIIIVSGIILCHISLSRMRKNPLAYQNRRLAVAGLYIGYFGLFVWFFGALALIASGF